MTILSVWDLLGAYYQALETTQNPTGVETAVTSLVDFNNFDFSESLMSQYSNLLQTVFDGL